MSTKPYFAYVRVSTTRQGTLGTSLTEQRSAIRRHAQQKCLRIIKEFQEQETAAKGGRPIFRSMMHDLQEGKASGVIMHKIDRGARNLRDWAELGELIDAGVEVHFANENLDLYSRGGRLSADIQAVVAADYIRNLREEVKKGFYGRIKQGYYPMPAPIGYLDMGGGKAKAIDPVYAPLVRKTFELYASGRYSLDSLAVEMNGLGLRRKSGKPVSRNTIADILHNLFYAGIIRLKTSEEYFIGLHQPLITKQLFDRAQRMLVDRVNKQSRSTTALREAFLFRRLLKCASCNYHLVGERQKGHIYYRCHTRTCPQKSIREEKVRTFVRSTIRKLEPKPDESDRFQNWLSARRHRINEHIAKRRAALLGQLEDTRHYLGRLTDALISDSIDKVMFLERKNNLIAKEVELRDLLVNVEVTEHESLKKFESALAFVKIASLTFEYAPYERKREVIKTIIERLGVNHKKISCKLHDPFEMVLLQKKNPDRESN
ncbi:MAG TPA: recombinase family protein [Pirellulaceae bacterium]|nr:recombinase family protein [Pyrinomonadaceae bacterium]HMP65572.1 recombinase family protein [Pyrinomonadaceae bacterium]HMP70722.1 recombinase family protein [Pirellulaceae bacterium]